MKDFTYFNSKLLTFLGENGEMIKVPDFVKRSAKNYRFDHNKKILQKKCIGCGKYYDVQLFDSGKFVDIHDELKIHFYSDESGYATRCVSCNATADKSADKPDVSVSISNASIKLTEDNWMYIRMVAAAEMRSEQEYLNDIISVIRKHNTFDYTYNKKIK